jgi:diketogulonate reductase-like aldo/keto reductase
MQKKLFDHTGLELPVIGQGTWNVPESGAGLAEAKRALRRGVELGMTHLDTAEMYGDGHVEEILGDVITGLARESLFITTKVLPSNATYKGTLAACDRSLRRLKIDYLDLYLLHWPSNYPLEETMKALEKLVEDGKTKFIGVSNFDLDELREAASFLRNVPLACNQVLYHVRERGIEHDVLPYCVREKIAVVAYTPFGRSRFPKNATAEDSVLGRIVRKHEATARQIILAFLTRGPALFTIPKAATIAHVEENAAAGDIQLDADDIAQIDDAFPIGAKGSLATL